MADWKEKYLARLRKTGNVTISANAAKVSRRNVYLQMENDTEFAAACADAKDEAADYLEEEARRRAYTGTLKPVFQGGAEVGRIREYSDSLMMFLLKGIRPDKYADRKHITGAGGGPIQIKQSYDELANLPTEDLARLHVDTLGDQEADR